jgi:hypothetical protein
MGRFGKAAGKQELLRLQLPFLNPRCDSGPGGLSQLELYRPLRFPLHDHCSGPNLVAVGDVPNVQIDEIAAPELAVDCEVEHGQVSNLVRILELNPDGPNVLRLQGWLLSNQLALIPGFQVTSRFHDRLLCC